MFKKISNKIKSKKSQIERDELKVPSGNLLGESDELKVKNKNFQHAVFVHIPKTAGTSFRNALENNFPVIKDYGSNSDVTNSIVKEFVYGEHSNMCEFYDWFKDNGQILSGHYPLMKYVNFAPASSLLTFIREPLSQVISHYNHFKNNYSYENKFEDFVKNPQFRNLQTRMLSGIPIGLIGHIGITKYYNQSLELINASLGTDLPVLNSNESVKQVVSESSISEQQLQMVKNHNKRDVELYKHCLWLHEQRYKLFTENKPWVFGYANINPTNILHGVAFYDDSDAAVELSIVIDDKVVANVKAEHLHHGHGGLIFPRHRYVAYNFRLNDLDDDVFIDKAINVVVKNTGQQVNFNHLKVM